MAAEKEIRLPRWVGVARIREGEVAPDGISYRFFNQSVLVRIKFLRLIGIKLMLDWQHPTNSRLVVLRRAWVELAGLDPLSSAPGWGWEVFLEIKQRRRST